MYCSCYSLGCPVAPPTPKRAATCSMRSQRTLRQIGSSSKKRSKAWHRGTETGFKGAAQPTANLLIRSEEHTSELQSRGHLVCRLLLEKKKKNTRKKI